MDSSPIFHATQITMTLTAKCRASPAAPPAGVRDAKGFREHLPCTKNAERMQKMPCTACHVSFRKLSHPLVEEMRKNMDNHGKATRIAALSRGFSSSVLQESSPKQNSSLRGGGDRPRRVRTAVVCCPKLLVRITDKFTPASASHLIPCASEPPTGIVTVGVLGGVNARHIKRSHHSIERSYSSLGFAGV